MVFKKRFRSRGRFIRRTRRRRNGSKRLRSLIKRTVRRMSEIKYSTSSSSFNVDGSGTLTHDVTPTFNQGVGKNNRIGNKIRYKMLTVNFEVFLARGVNLASGFVPGVRVVIFQGRTDITLTNAFGGIADQTTFLTTFKGTAARILYDKFFVIEPWGADDTSAEGTAPRRVQRKVHFRVNNNVDFLDAADTVPDDQKDRYYIMFVTSQFGATTDQIEIQGSWFSRLSFFDI